MLQKCYDCVPIMFHICANSVLNDVPIMSPTMSQNCPACVLKVFYTCSNVHQKCPNSRRACLKCLSNVSQTYSQSVPDSILQMLQKRFKSVPNMFQQRTRFNHTSIVFRKFSKVCPKCSQVSQTCPTSVANVFETCAKSSSKCSPCVSKVFQ